MSYFTLKHNRTKKPFGPVRLNINHPLAKYCVVAIYGEYDAVTGKRLNYKTGASVGHDQTGKAVYTPNTGDDVAYIAAPSDRNALIEAYQEATLIWAGKIDSMDAYMGLIGTPYYSGSWADPYIGLGLGRQSSLTKGKVHWNDNGSGAAEISGNTFLETGVWHEFVATLNIASNEVNFYQDGVFHSNDTNVGNGPISLSGDASYNDWAINQSDRYGNDTSGIAGHCSYSFVFAKELSADWIRKLYDNPWQLLQSIETPIYIEAGAAPLVADMPQGLHGLDNGINPQRSQRLNGELQ